MPTLATIVGWLGIFGGTGAAIAAAFFLPNPWRARALALAIGLALLSGVYLKIRHDAQAEVITRIEKEKTDAIDKARTARDRIRALCNRNPAQCVPDDYFRD